MHGTGHRRDTRPRRRGAAPTGLWLLLVLTACAGAPTPVGPSGNAVTVTVTPPSAILVIGAGLEFEASVEGSNDPSVSWSVTCGTIDAAPTSVAFTAPDVVGTCALTATSQADTSASGSAVIEVVRSAITIDPAEAEAFTGQTRTFTAVIATGTSTDVVWSLSEGCGSLAGETGVTVAYTAPDQAPTEPCDLSVASAADALLGSSARVTVYDPPQATLEVDPNPAAAGVPTVFAWTLSNPTKTLSLTCEIDTFGDGAGFSYTVSGCGDEGAAATQSHTYTTPGSYGVALRVLQAGTELRSLSASVRVRRELVQVSSRNSQSLAIDSAGFVWAWGRNVEGQLGDGTTIDREVPVPVCLSGSTETQCVPFRVGRGGSVSAGGFNALAVDEEGRVWAWGRNNNGVLGDGTLTDRLNPTPVCASGSTGAGCVHFSVGPSGRVVSRSHSLAVDAGGQVWSWGGNVNGGLGDGTTIRRLNPGRVCSSGSGDRCEPFEIGSSRELTAGILFSVAVDGNGAVWSWGRNEDAELGDGTLTNRSHPGPVCASVSESRGCVQLSIGPNGRISAGSRHVLAVNGDGLVRAWGLNSNRQLGDGTTTTRTTPVSVCASGGGSAPCQPLQLGADASVAAGAAFSLALAGDGAVVAWGRNFNGQLGDGTTTARENPVAVCAVGSAGSACDALRLTERAAIEAGGSHALALTGAGALLAWGLNNRGQLGDGTTDERTTPVLVPLP